MYTKEEVKQLKKEFWEGFGTYCNTLTQFKKRKSKFLLYNTKMKGVELKFDANRKGAYVILELNHSNSTKRFDMFEKFERLKPLIEKKLNNNLIWDFAYVRECGTEVCRIYSHKNGIDIHNRLQWADFYEFMSTEMLRLEKAFTLLKDACDEN